MEPQLVGPTTGRGTVAEQLADLHDRVRAEFPDVRRLAVALYDPLGDRVRTFVHSTDGPVPLSHYEVRLAEVGSLRSLVEGRRERVIDDLAALPATTSRHTRCILQAGYRSSYTVPFYERDRFCGFVFYDSPEPRYFSPEVVRYLSLYSRLVALVVTTALSPVPLLLSAVRVASHMTHVRDLETAAHLQRMARYAVLIAGEVADAESRSDEWVAFLGHLAPLHDVGKVGIPDRILFKAGPLDADELAVMRSHVEKGVELVDAVTNEFGLARMPHVRMLRNIVACHHECPDGSGYPAGLAGDEVPLEARVVAVADVFDALTSVRPYKAAWTSERAVAFLRERAGRMLDRACVEALVRRLDEVEEVRVSLRDPADAAVSHEGYLEAL